MSLSGKRSLFTDKVCRLCATVGDKLLPIFDSSGSKVDLKIKECVPTLNIRQDDLKPQQICLECITKLNMYNEFQKQCLFSDSKFDSLLKQCHWGDEENVIKASTKNLSKLKDEQMPDEGVIVLSNVDSTVQESKEQDFVVMIELKFKEDLTELPDGDNVDVHPLVDYRGSKENASLKGDDSSSFSRPDRISGEYVASNQTLNKLESEGEAALASNPIPNSLKGAKKIFECFLCKKQFDRLSRLNNHLARHSDLKPFKCPTCAKTFTLKRDLTVHSKLHSRTFVCETCDKVFTSKTKLGRHSRTHTGERPYVCGTCGKGFSEKRNLDNHVRTHTGERPYHCQTCSKSFTVRSHMVDHYKVHLESTLMHECRKCNKKFKWKNNYNKHMKTHS